MRRSRSSRRPLFDTLVRSSNALRLFLEFCGVHGGGDVWTSLTMFWLDIEHYRQLVGDADTMACHGLKLWDDYLAAGGDGKGGDGYPTNSRQQHVRSVLPRAELRRLRRVCGAYESARAARAAAAAATATATAKTSKLNRENKKHVKRPRPCAPLPDDRRLGLNTFSRAQAFVKIYLSRHAMPAFYASDAYSKSLISMAPSPDRASVDSAAVVALQESAPSSDCDNKESHSKVQEKHTTDNSKRSISGALPETAETKAASKQQHNHHLIEVLSDKELSVYLEAFVANYKPDALGGLKLWGLISSELEPAAQYAVHLLGNPNIMRPSDYSDEEAELNTSEVKSACASIVAAGKRLRDTYFTAGKRRSLAFYGSSNDLHRKILGVSESTRKRVEKCLKPPKCLQKETWGSSLFRSNTSNGSSSSSSKGSSSRSSSSSSSSSISSSSSSGGGGSSSSSSSSNSSSSSGGKNSQSNNSSVSSGSTSSEKKGDAGGTDNTTRTPALSATTGKRDSPRDRLRAEVLEIFAAFKQAQLEVEAEMNTKVWPYFEDSELFESMVSISKGDEWQVQKRTKLQKLAEATAEAILASTKAIGLLAAEMHNRDAADGDKEVGNGEDETTTAMLRPFATANSDPSTSDVPEVLCALRTTRAAHLGHKQPRKQWNGGEEKLTQRRVPCGQMSHFLRIVVQPDDKVAGSRESEDESAMALAASAAVSSEATSTATTTATAALAAASSSSSSSAATGASSSSSSSSSAAATVAASASASTSSSSSLSSSSSSSSSSVVATVVDDDDDEDDGGFGTADDVTKQSPPRRRRSMFSWNSPVTSPGSEKKSPGLWQKFSAARNKNDEQKRPSDSPVETMPRIFPVPVLAPETMAPRLLCGMLWTSSADVMVRATGNAVLSAEDVDQILAFCRPTDQINVGLSEVGVEVDNVVQRNVVGSDTDATGMGEEEKVLRFILPSRSSEKYLLDRKSVV